MSQTNTDTTETSDEDWLYVIIDLFCGAGGFSTGMVHSIVDKHRAQIAGETGLDTDAVSPTHERVQWWLGQNVKLVAINHMDEACAVYKANHPFATVINSDVQSVHPPAVLDGERPDILIAGPSCVPYSPAGGSSLAADDQRRMHPRTITNFLELTRPRAFMCENVPQFTSWGPLEGFDEDDGPTMRKDGSLFEDWVGTIKNELGYSVDWDTLYADEFGDPQRRRRFFIQGRLEHEPVFPEQTHGERANLDPKRTAADILDLDSPGNSIFVRDLLNPRHRRLSNTTIARIATGIRRNCRECLEPFADVIEALDKDDGDIKSLRNDRLIPVEYAHVAAQALDEPFLVAFPDRPEAAPDGGEVAPVPSPWPHDSPVTTPRSEAPVPTLSPPAAAAAASRSTSWVTKFYKSDVEHPIDVPLHTVCAKGDNLYLSTAETFFLRQDNGDGAYPPSVDSPLSTITTSGNIGLITPSVTSLVLPRNGKMRGDNSNPAYRTHSRPLHTITAKNNDGYLMTVTSQFLAPKYSSRQSQRPRTRRLNRPIMTIPARKHGGPANLVTPVAHDIASNTASFDASPWEDLPNRQEVALCLPSQYPLALDVKYRLLKPRELARGQGFPDDYEFPLDNKSDTTEVIGNAVPVHLSEALCRTLLSPTAQPTFNRYGSTPEPAAPEMSASDD